MSCNVDRTEVMLQESLRSFNELVEFFNGSHVEAMYYLSSKQNISTPANMNLYLVLHSLKVTEDTNFKLALERHNERKA